MADIQLHSVNAIRYGGHRQHAPTHDDKDGLMKLLHKSVAVAVGVVLAISAGAGAASSRTLTYPEVQGWNDVVSGSHWVHAKDLANDGRFVSTVGQISSSSSASAVNKLGMGYTAHKKATVSPATVKNIRICYSRTALPMACSSWYSTGY